MATLPQIKIRATYMRGGTSKGVFFNVADLPDVARQPGPGRDRVLQRMIGSPDPYAKQIDGMGGATSSTTKVVLVAPSSKLGHDVDYLFGQVSIDGDFIDWSGNCGNLTAAVGPFAIEQGLIAGEKIPENGTIEITIWQANIQKTIKAQVPITGGMVQETGNFELDGVTFPAAEIKIAFCDPSDSESSMFPTGNIVDLLEVPGIGSFDCTLINSGIPTIFLNAKDLGYTGTELQEAINNDQDALSRFETIRAHGALKMGLITSIDEAKTRQHTPKIAFVAPAQEYLTSSGKSLQPQDMDLTVRALSMGKLHHAMMGTAAVAIGTAAAIPGTLVNLSAGGGNLEEVCFGHPSGTLRVGAETQCESDVWAVNQVTMSRSARRLMDGYVYIPGEFLL